MAVTAQIIYDAGGSSSKVHNSSPKITNLPEFAGVFRGRELTLKHRRIASGLTRLDQLIDGGIVRGRINEIIGATGSGKTSLAMAFAAQVTRNEAAAWIETGDSLDPASLISAGVEPARMLWVSCRYPNLPSRPNGVNGTAASGIERGQSPVASLKAAEWILAVGGFGLIILDFGTTVGFQSQNMTLRLARAAERSGAAILILAQQRLCGTFSALSLSLHRSRICFSAIRRGGTTTFDGQVIEAQVTRNKLGGAGDATHWMAAIDPSSTASDLDSEQIAIASPRAFAKGGS